MLSKEDRDSWKVPSMKTVFWFGKKHAYCVIIPVINEGERIRNLLKRMEEILVPSYADIIIVDGGSIDGSLEVEWLQKIGVRGLILKTGPGRLSAQLRCAYAFALDLGYEGIVTIDGNNKDDPCAIQQFIDALRNGVDFVQASRFLPDGVALNTPFLRNAAIRFIHAPLLSLASGFRWTDTTQGFRGYSSRMLLDPKIAIFRDEFVNYELLAYLSWRAPRLHYVCTELPSTRCYPRGKVPTKISKFRGNIEILVTLLKVCAGKYED